jgi:hypothetical protein
MGLFVICHDLDQFFSTKRFVDSRIAVTEQFICQSSQRLQLDIRDVGTRTLRETVDKEHVMALLESGQRSYATALASSVQCRAFLEHAPAQIGIDQATPHLIDRSAKAGISEPFLGGPAMGPLGLEDTHGSGMECST